jgi:hypothetical protein
MFLLFHFYLFFIIHRNLLFILRYFSNFLIAHLIFLYLLYFIEIILFIFHSTYLFINIYFYSICYYCLFNDISLVITYFIALTLLLFFVSLTTSILTFVHLLYISFSNLNAILESISTPISTDWYAHFSLWLFCGDILHCYLLMRCLIPLPLDCNLNFSYILTAIIINYNHNYWKL